MSTGKGPPIYIDTSEFQRRSRSAGLKATGLVPALLAFGNGQAFIWDTRVLSQVLTREYPRHPLTPRALEDMREPLLRFFVVLPDGRWAPDPAVFSATDGNPGRAS